MKMEYKLNPIQRAQADSIISSLVTYDDEIEKFVYEHIYTRDALTAENERLREALKEIEQEADGYSDITNEGTPNLGMKIVTICQSALSQEGARG